MPVTRPVLIQGERIDNHTKGEGLFWLPLDPHYHDVKCAIYYRSTLEWKPWIGEKLSWILDPKATCEGGIITFDCQKERDFYCLWPDPGWEEKEKKVKAFPPWTNTKYLISSTTQSITPHNKNLSALFEGMGQRHVVYLVVSSTPSSEERTNFLNGWSSKKKGFSTKGTSLCRCWVLEGQQVTQIYFRKLCILL